MKISRATVDQWTEIEQFLSNARHVYADAGREDLPALIRSDLALIGRPDLSGQEPICALLIFQRASRPSTLPAHAPTREILRYAAIASGRSPVSDLPILIDAAWPRLAGQGPGFEAQAYGSQHWIVRPLLACGFEIVERIEFLRLSRLQQRSELGIVVEGTVALPNEPADADGVTTRTASPDDLAHLAELDAAAFPPRWHFGERDLFTLLLGGTMRLAYAGDRLAGYWAQTQTANQEAHLARLAVEPALQGRGLGRFLLADAIAYARSEKYQSILLNTQTDNARALRLYRWFGFRSTGRIVPILTRRDNGIE